MIGAASRVSPLITCFVRRECLWIEQEEVLPSTPPAVRALIRKLRGTEPGPYQSVGLLRRSRPQADSTIVLAKTGSLGVAARQWTLARSSKRVRGGGITRPRPDARPTSVKMVPCCGPNW